MPEVPYRVEKPWGYELIWARTDRYVGKILHVKAGHVLSLQYHNVKDETIFLWTGKILFEIQEGDAMVTREMLLRIANDPDVEFTMTPRAMKSYAEFMYKTGTIKRLPEKWSELFFGETGELNGS